MSVNFGCGDLGSRSSARERVVAAAVGSLAGKRVAAADRGTGNRQGETELSVCFQV